MTFKKRMEAVRTMEARAKVLEKVSTRARLTKDDIALLVVMHTAEEAALNILINEEENITITTEVE